MTSIGCEKLLSILIDLLFKKLRKDKTLQLSHLKESSLKDLLVTAPEMIAAVFTKSSLIQSFLSSGMIDEKYKRCADLYGPISSLKIDWSKINGGKRWFIAVLPILSVNFFLRVKYLNSSMMIIISYLTEIIEENFGD